MVFWNAGRKSETEIKKSMMRKCLFSVFSAFLLRSVWQRCVFRLIRNDYGHWNAIKVSQFRFWHVGSPKRHIRFLKLSESKMASLESVFSPFRSKKMIVRVSWEKKLWWKNSEMWNFWVSTWGARFWNLKRCFDQFLLISLTSVKKNHR